MWYIFQVLRNYPYWVSLLSVFSGTFCHFLQKRALYYRRFEHKFQKDKIIFQIHDSRGLFLSIESSSILNLKHRYQRVHNIKELKGIIKIPASFSLKFTNITILSNIQVFVKWICTYKQKYEPLMKFSVSLLKLLCSNILK